MCKQSKYKTLFPALKTLDLDIVVIENDQRLIEHLLSQMEGSTLDFKRDQYKLESNKQKSKFVKDIVCMANTPRCGSAYILVGVNEKNGRAGDVLGTSVHYDPAVFQDLISANTNPVVQISYRQVEHSGSIVGLIEIPEDQQGPVMVAKRFGIIQQGVVYSRRGAQNCVAESHEIRRIANWYGGKSSEGTVEYPPEASWDAFFRACDEFDPARVYIAVLDGAKNVDSDECQSFATIGWQLVVDFDVATEECGMYSNVEPYLSQKKSLRLIALDEPTAYVSPTTSVWIAANGLSSRPSTIQARTWREWNQGKAQPLLRAMTSVAQTTEPSPVTAVVLGGDSEYLRTVCDLLDQAFKDRLTFVFAGDTSDTASYLAEKFEGREVPISLRAICGGLRFHLPQAERVEDIQLPGLNGRVCVVPPDRARWVEEELEIAHLNVGVESSGSGSDLEEFLKGQPISWYGLNLGVDVQRTITPRLEDRVSGELASRTTRRLNLLHWPGGGGSTVARRVLWNVHRQYPSLLAKRVLSEPLVERLRYLFDLTQLPLLVLVEDSVTNSDDLDRVYDRLRSENIPALLFRVARRESASTQTGSFYLDGMLDDAEAAAFAGRLIAEVPSRRATLERLKGESDRQRRTPFYFGLVAFGKDFAGLEPYVSHRIKETPEHALVLCQVSSLLYHFGQQETPIQLLSSILSLPRAKLVSISSIMSSLLQELFVQLPDLSLRPAHELIANEILEQVLGKRSGDKRNWRSGIAQCAVETIEIAAKHNDHPGGAIAELMRSVIIERGIQETPAGLPEGHFSSLISAIPSSDGQHRVLKELTDLFPNEAHFWAHLGRFYTRTWRDHSEAHRCHDESLRITPDDPVLHHMAGMAFRGELYELLDQLGHGDLEESAEIRIKSLAEESLVRFRDSRELDPRSEHSYISAVELIARLVVVIARQKGYESSLEEFLYSSSEVWYRELVDSAETLMSELLLNRGGESESHYFQDARAKLDRSYGDTSRAIQGWTNLLDRQDTYRPPLRRNIINAYLSRSGWDWSQLTSKEIQRISDLAQENLEEEPNSDQNLRIWFRSVRATGKLPLGVIAERLAYRRNQRPTIDTLYYLYIIKYLQADSGVGQASSEVASLTEECAGITANLPYRTRSFEWLGKDTGAKALVHVSALGKWNNTTEFWSDTSRLRVVTGRISKIRGPASGDIELPNGLRAFFVPAKGRIKGGYLPNRDIGREVEFFLGFSYAGLRAWSVRGIGPIG